MEHERIVSFSGVMDRALDYDSRGCGFESHLKLLIFLSVETTIFSDPHDASFKQLSMIIAYGTVEFPLLSSAALPMTIS